MKLIDASILGYTKNQIRTLQYIHSLYILPSMTPMNIATHNMRAYQSCRDE